MRSTNLSDNKSALQDEDSRRSSVWQIMGHVYCEFSSQSTIHGIKYTTQAKSKVGRCLWFAIVVISIIAAWQLANEFYKRHEMANMRTLVVSNQYPSWNLELPAITFCHSDVVALHRFESLAAKKHIRMPFGITMEEFQKNLKYLWIGILPSNQFEREMYIVDRVLFRNRMTLAELFELLSPKCSDFIVMCQFEGQTKNCESFIKPSYTPYGLCCSFNYAYMKNERSMLQLTNGEQALTSLLSTSLTLLPPRYSQKPVHWRVLFSRVLLSCGQAPLLTKRTMFFVCHRWNYTDRDYYSVSFGGHYILSFLIKSYGPTDRISSLMYGDGVRVLIHEKKTYPGPSSLEFVAATGQETVARLYGRYLTASPEVLSMKREDRDCRKSIPANSFYRADNCYVKCREKAFFHFCGCLPFFSSSIHSGQRICNISDISCLTRVKQKAYSLTLRGPFCRCLPDCESTMYSLVSTALPLNAPQFNPSAFYQKARKTPNATAVHITYSDQSAMLERREVVLSWINLVSSLGGVFGLFLGCSFVSIIEIFYFFVIYFIVKLREAQRAM